MNIIGKNRIGNLTSEGSNRTFKAMNPATGEQLQSEFYIANDKDVNDSLIIATKAADKLKTLDTAKRIQFLDAIADEIMNLGDLLIDTASKETGLPEGRITGERGRTVNQLKLFARLLEEGSWTDAIIETALPDRQPLPKPDIRRMLVPVGPVVVFSASNFPLAFSTAGGDTASALAGGNPVIVKAHPSHPATNALVSSAILAAAEKTGMPDGIYSTLYSDNYEVGLELVKHPLTKSVAFTGSYTGGMALYKAALDREEPIPVFAEMGSTNPVVLLPDAINNNSDEIAGQLSSSISLGSGQFCTKPGILATIEKKGLEPFQEKLAEELAKNQNQTMLNTQIWESFNKRRLEVLNEKGVHLVGGASADKQVRKASSSLAVVSFSDFYSNNLLTEEVFGPFSLMVVCKDENELAQFADLIKGQLTISVFATDSDTKKYKDVFPRLAAKSGRLIFNGPPTGVEVCHAMQHGGPFPATTDSRFTSVGTEAIKRFARPVAFQNTPDTVLPPELQDANPRGIWRKVNGELSKSGIQ